MLIRILDRIGKQHGLPKAIRTDNGKEFCGRAMLIWAHERGVKLFLIEPGPRQGGQLLRGGCSRSRVGLLMVK